MKQIVFTSMFCWIFFFSMVGQKDSTFFPLTISIFNNATLMPGTNLIILPIHPGICIGTEFYYKHNGKNELFQTAKLGVYYHKYASTGIQIYSEFGYRHTFNFGLGLEARLGIGYVHSIIYSDMFVLENGQYAKKNGIGRAQFMLPDIALNVSYKFVNDLRLYLEYQFWLQRPFNKEYIPVIPNISFHIGASIPINKLGKP